MTPAHLSSTRKPLTSGSTKILEVHLGFAKVLFKEVSSRTCSIGQELNPFWAPWGRKITEARGVHLLLLERVHRLADGAVHVQSHGRVEAPRSPDEGEPLGVPIQRWRENPKGKKMKRQCNTHLNTPCCNENNFGFLIKRGTRVWFFPTILDLCSAELSGASTAPQMKGTQPWQDLNNQGFVLLVVERWFPLPIGIGLELRHGFGTFAANKRRRQPLAAAKAPVLGIEGLAPRSLHQAIQFRQPGLGHLPSIHRSIPRSDSP